MNSANFDEWGRMTANLGLEAPGATPLLQNIILYPFVNPATEILDATGLPSSLHVTAIASAADGTQIWKITHNGVDTHPIHWHLYDVQLLNRVTWDNIIIPPEATELGWKDTVRISPLEDTIVAVRPIVPTIPFGVLDSRRAYNPAMPLGAHGDAAGPTGTEAGFNNTDTAGNPIDPIINAVVDFGWEYVFHCHILSHEEMDMMRPVTVHVARLLPAAPVLSITGTGPFSLTWTDGTPVNYLNPATWTNPGTAEVGYRVQRATVIAGVVGAYSTIGTALANQTTFADITAVAGATYTYRVVVFNAAGNQTSNIALIGPPATYTLSGTISAGAAFATGSVSAATAAGVFMGTFPIGASGTYSLSLPAGSYKLYVQPTNVGYANQWVGGGGLYFANATTFVLTANQTANITLVGPPANPILSGTISAGAAFATGSVSAATAAGVFMGTFPIGASGTYSLSLPAGSYK
ncbi:MAG TPA: multicopper oxidase domain-containing protein, partial [Kineosporiaceae bacterium]|nr:multicopper oxidase domain-containing protein [Kineosporiaceae bacterium]